MLLNVNHGMCVCEGVCVCAVNGFLWLPPWHAQLLTVDALPSQQPNHAHPIMEPRLRLPRLSELSRCLPVPWKTKKKTKKNMPSAHALTSKQYTSDCGRDFHGTLID